jgi:hypothetical protein
MNLFRYFDSVMEQRPGMLLRKLEYAGDSFTEGTFNTINKSHSYWQFHYYRPCGEPGGDDLTLQVL